MTSIITSAPVSPGSLRPGSADFTSRVGTAYDSDQTAAYTSSPIAFASCTVLVSIVGTATSFTCQVERSDTDPNGGFGANWSPAAAALTGNASNISFAPVSYSEPAQGWWRLSFTAISGGYVNASISGVSP